MTTLSAAALVGAVSVRAAPPRADDPDWPCQQRLVPKLATAAYWNGPSLDNAGDWRTDPVVANTSEAVVSSHAAGATVLRQIRMTEMNGLIGQLADKMSERRSVPAGSCPVRR